MLTADRQQGQEDLLSRMGGCWKGKRSQRRCGRVPEVGIGGDRLPRPGSSQGEGPCTLLHYCWDRMGGFQTHCLMGQGQVLGVR